MSDASQSRLSLQMSEYAHGGCARAITTYMGVRLLDVCSDVDTKQNVCVNHAIDQKCQLLVMSRIGCQPRMPTGRHLTPSVHSPHSDMSTCQSRRRDRRKHDW
jgi:hypothetical protein